MLVEEKTVKRLRQKDKDAFNEVYYAYHNLLFYLILQIVGNETVAEDLTQDAFLKMLENICLLKRASGFHSYLLTIAKRSAFEYVRKKKEDELLEPERLGVEEQPTFLLAELHDFLDEKENLVMVLHVVYEFSFQEIEEVANIPHSTAKRIYDGALKKAREHYGVRL